MNPTGALFAVCIACCLAGSAGAEDRPWYAFDREDHQEWTLALSGGAALLHLDGDTTFDESEGDTEISLDGTLDLDDREEFWAEADLQFLPGQHLRFAYSPFRLSAGEVLDTAIVVDGETYDVGDFVDSEVKFDQYEISFRSAFWFADTFSLAPLVQVSLVDAEARIENETLDLRESEEALLPLPYLGLRAELYPLARLQLFAEGKGFTIGSRATIVEVVGGVALHLTRNFSISGRYRWQNYRLDIDDFELDLEIAGPLLAATVRF